MMKKLISVLLIAAMVLSFASCGSKNIVELDVNSSGGKYAGKTVIVHSNDVHGAIEGYSYMAALKQSIESEGGTVILADDGDFSNGNIYVSISKGDSAVTLMNEAGYDVVALGNHEFDFGYDCLKENINHGTFKTICSNVYKDGKSIFDENVIFKVGKMKIGFFALLSPQTQTKVNPSLVEGITFTADEDLYDAAQLQIDALKAQKCDIIICLSHLGVDDESAGNRSLDVIENVEGIDFMIDGHSHTVMSYTAPDKENHEVPIQSTGAQFENIGIIVIDNATRQIESYELISTENLERDELVLAVAKNITETVDDEFGAVFAKTLVDLDGEKDNIRTSETNLGDLITDAIFWSATNESELKVDNEHVVAILNSGGIRASITKGDISRSDIKTVLPFGNTIAVEYVTGEELLEVLEAGTFTTPESIGAFPQISGMKIEIDTSKAYDAGEEYPDSTYCKPKTINRVTILEVNGQPFDKDATYAVVTNDFCAAGGDTYYAFYRAYSEGNGFDTSIPTDETLVNYINSALGGEIGSEYAESQGRIIIK